MTPAGPRRGGATLDTRLSPDGKTVTVVMDCFHHKTDADFDFADRDAAAAAFENCIVAVAMTHEERFNCGCAKQHMPA